MKKIIIIGAGITGLCSGIFLLKKGFEVSIYEKNDFAGGCCTGWVRDGYYIDNCMHWLTGTNQHTKTFKLWKDVGAISEVSNLYQGDYFYKSIYNSDSIELDKNTEILRKNMLSLSIEDKKEIDLFIDTVNNFIKLNKELSFTNKIFHKPIYYLKSYFKYRHLSLEDLSKRFKHPLLKKMFTDFLPKEYCSLALIYAYATFASGNGKVYSKGSRAFAENILNKYIDLGGFIHFKSEVTSIQIKNNKIESITINNTDTISADEYIYTGSPKYLFNNLIDNSYQPNVLKEKYEKNDINPIYSSFHVAFKLKKKHNQFNDSTIFEIDPIRVGTSYITRLMIKDYSYLYPNKSDTIIQSFIVQNEEDYKLFEHLAKNNHEEYKKLKETISNNILNAITKQYPETLNSIKILDSWTPYTYTEYFNSYLGSYMGFTFTKKSNIKDIPVKLKNLKNFYLLTYWQKICGGLPIGLDLGNSVSKLIK